MAGSETATRNVSVLSTQELGEATFEVKDVKVSLDGPALRTGEIETDADGQLTNAFFVNSTIKNIGDASGEKDVVLAETATGDVLRGNDDPLPLASGESGAANFGVDAD